MRFMVRTMPVPLAALCVLYREKPRNPFSNLPVQHRHRKEAKELAFMHRYCPSLSEMPDQAADNSPPRYIHS